MLRKTSILVSIALLVSVTACSSKSSSPSGAAAGAPGAAVSTSCPAHNTKAFAKTRFVADAGLAAGAFKHWIYTPYRDGDFSKGANGRAKAIVKAVLAGGFVVNRLDAAKTMAESNPTLCKLAIAPLGRLESSVKGIVSTGKSGTINPSEVTSGSGSLAQFQSAATSAGAAFKPQNASIPGVS